MIKSLLKSTLLLFTILLGFQVQAQFGCTDEAACNYNSSATINDGSCDYGNFYIPFVLGDGPIVQSCVPVSGYWLPDQDIIEAIILSDPYCLETTWDNVCQTAYDNALGCEFGPSWYIPFDVNDGLRPIYTCDPIPGFIEANMSCFSQVVNNDAFCLYNTWDFVCSQTYHECLFGCPNPQWYVPLELGFALPVQACLQPEGYMPVDNAIFDVFENDPYCIQTAWDQTCYDAYLMARFGCLAEWYLPTSDDGSDFPVLACSPLIGYRSVPNQSCLVNLLIDNSQCLEFGWDEFCEEQYDACIEGCTYDWACNYWPLALKDDGSCERAGCTDSSASNYEPTAACDDGSCVFAGNACPGDFTNDQVVNASDLLSFLAVFGSSCL